MLFSRRLHPNEFLLLILCLRLSSLARSLLVPLSGLIFGQCVGLERILFLLIFVTKDISKRVGCQSTIKNQTLLLLNRNKKVWQHLENFVNLRKKFSLNDLEILVKYNQDFIINVIVKFKNFSLRGFSKSSKTTTKWDFYIYLLFRIFNASKE